MKRLVLALVGIFAVIGLLAAPAQAKKKKKPAPAATVKQSYDNGHLPPPNDKRTNEGAQGRINATEDAAQQADSPQFDHRP